jgi:hypothetical protein
MEYCNSPAGSTTLADQRAAGGDREPFRVRFWGVGGATFVGSGGDNTLKLTKLAVLVPAAFRDITYHR